MPEALALLALFLRSSAARNLPAFSAMLWENSRLRTNPAPDIHSERCTAFLEERYQGRLRPGDSHIGLFL